MKKKVDRKDDILWQMLESELDGIEDIREVQRFIRGESEHFDIGFGELTIEPYDGRQGSSSFRVRHGKLGEEVIGRAPLGSLLHDLLHYRRKQQGFMPTHLN